MSSTAIILLTIFIGMIITAIARIYADHVEIIQKRNHRHIERMRQLELGILPKEKEPESFED